MSLRLWLERFVLLLLLFDEPSDLYCALRLLIGRSTVSSFAPDLYSSLLKPEGPGLKTDAIESNNGHKTLTCETKKK